MGRLTGILTILCATCVTVSCVSVGRSPESGYSKKSTQTTQSGWNRSADSSDHRSQHPESEVTNTKIRLKQLENQLSSKRELEQYSKALPWFQNDEEKIAFLSSGNYEDRQNWIKENDLQGRALSTSSQLQELVDVQDIALGMPENLVRKAWGEPQSIEVSGAAAFHNQRWKYSKYISTPDGYKTELKTVYFEGGKVVGWEFD